MVTEESIERSFANVKKDMMKMQANILEISGKQAELFEVLTKLRKFLEVKKLVRSKKKR